MPAHRRALVRDVNPHLICVLCSGYFIEATTIIECLHSFCRSCLVKYLGTSKFCPICDVQLHKNNPLLSVRCDQALQQLVYKLIPGLYGREMARRRKYYAELGGGSSTDLEGSEFPVGDAYFSPDDSISLSLEFISGSGSSEDSCGSETEDSQSVDKQGVHHRRYLQCPAAVTMSHLQKFLRMKYGLSHDLKVDIIYEGEVLTEDFSLMDVAYTFNWKRTTPMRFKFRFLQKSQIVQQTALKEVELPMKDEEQSGTKNTKYKSDKTAVNGHKTKTITISIEKPHSMEQPISVRPYTNEVNEIKPKSKNMKRSQVKPVEKSKESAPEPKRIKIVEPLPVQPTKPEKKKHSEKVRMVEPIKIHQPLVEVIEVINEEEVNEVDEEEEVAIEEDEEVDDDDEEERDYMEDIIQEEEEEENEDDCRLRISTMDEDIAMVEEEKEPEVVESEPENEPQPEPEHIPEPEPIEEEPIVPVYSKSSEKRREKKKSKKAKHHHHHRHHDRRRDSPPAATILHSPENDIMKLKIKLTDINSKPKYAVVDDYDDRKEINGNSPKHHDKYAEREYKKKSREEETKKVSSTNNMNSNKTEPIKPLMDSVPKERPAPIRIVNRHKSSSASKSPSPVAKSPVHKPNVSSSPKESPVHKMSASPKPVPIPRQNGIPKNEPMKLPPSSITVSKITAAEKEKMEQQKLFLNRTINNGLDSKRPSLEIMLVNAPKKSNTELNEPPTTKPLEVKKVMRPTPPSIPLSRLGKGLFGPKGSPPQLVLASKTTSPHDDSGALDLSGKSSRKSPDMESAIRNLVEGAQMRSLVPPEPLRIPMPSSIAMSNGSKLCTSNNNSTGYQHGTHQQQRSIKPGPNQTVRQIPNPSALLFRQQQQHVSAMNGLRPHHMSVPPVAPLRKIESMTKNIEKVAAGLTMKAAAIEAGYAIK